MRFNLIDRIDGWESGKSLKASKFLALGEEYLADHFPRFPVMPGVLMLEACVEAAAWLWRASTGFRLLREHYDLVILDLMPLAGPTAENEIAGLLAVTGPCQVFIVSDVRSRGSQQLASACARLRRMSLTAAGIIENFAPQGAGSPQHALVS